VSVEAIEAAVRAALGTRALAHVRAVASIDSKSDEAALAGFCARHGLPLQFYSAARIADVAAPRDGPVQRHLGVGAVCEPCALLASHDGRIVVPKTVAGDVTVAIAADRPPYSTPTDHA
jgi:cobalt-precorrin 5A hydrolase